MDYTNTPTGTWKPSTAYRKNRRNQSMMNESLLNQSKAMVDINNSYLSNSYINNSYVNSGLHPNFNIVAELNGKAIEEQDKDIEIERLKTTCTDLNNKALVADDLRKDNEILSKRLVESEDERQNQEELNKRQEDLIK